jgi:hypothetical protein
MLNVGISNEELAILDTYSDSHTDSVIYQRADQSGRSYFYLLPGRVAKHDCPWTCGCPKDRERMPALPNILIADIKDYVVW